MRASSRLATMAAAAALAACLFTAATAQNFVMKFGTATFNETQHNTSRSIKRLWRSAAMVRLRWGLSTKPTRADPAHDRGAAARHDRSIHRPADFYVGVDPRFGVFSAPMLFENKNASATLVDPALNKSILGFGDRQRTGRIRHFRLCPRLPAKSPILRIADSRARRSASMRPRSSGRQWPARRHRRPFTVQRGPSVAPAQRDRWHNERAVNLRLAQISGRSKWSPSPTTPCSCRSLRSANRGSISCRPTYERPSSIRPGRAEPRRRSPPSSWPRTKHGLTWAGGVRECRSPSARIAELKSVGDEVSKGDRRSRLSSKECAPRREALIASAGGAMALVVAVTQQPLGWTIHRIANIGIRAKSTRPPSS